MKHILHLILVMFPILLATSCKTQTTQTTRPQDITLQSKAKFLTNFITVESDGLSISISLHDALFAGATAADYTELQHKINIINSQYNIQAYNYWKDKIQQQRTTVQYSSVLEQPYNKYNVLERDKFLENFIYVENGIVVLNLSEEQAILYGATINGYQAICEGITDLNQMIQSGKITCSDVIKAFDEKRAYILSKNNINSKVLVDPPTPPTTYAFVDLIGAHIYESITFMGAPEIIVAVTANYIAAIAYVQDMETMQTHTHLGFSSHKNFTAGLTYPEGSHYSFICRKAVDTYDVAVRFVEKH